MCQDVTQQVTGSSLSGNMLNFQASVSGNGQRFSASQMRLWHSPCQRTPLGCNLVSHVSACWLTGLGLGTPSRYLARTISWNACKLLLLLLYNTQFCPGHVCMSSSVATCDTPVVCAVTYIDNLKTLLSASCMCATCSAVKVSSATIQKDHAI